MKIAIIGSRGFTDYKLFCEKLFSLEHEVSEIVSGGARGTDSLAKRFAYDYDIPYTEFIADWTLGRGAGMIRNNFMLKYSDKVIAFWDGVSRGTKQMIDNSKKCGKLLVLYNV